MTYLAEHALPIWIVGGLLVFLAWINYLNVRTTKSLLLIPIAVLLMAGALLAEWFVETPREAIRRTVYELADAIEANDLPGTLRYVSTSAADVRGDAEALMPRFTIEAANVIDVPKIDVDQRAVPPSADILVRGFVDGTLNRNGMKQSMLDWVHVTFVLEEGRWVVQDYTPENQLLGRARDRYRRRERDRLRSDDRRLPFSQ